MKVSSTFSRTVGRCPCWDLAPDPFLKGFNDWGGGKSKLLHHDGQWGPQSDVKEPQKEHLHMTVDTLLTSLLGLALLPRNPNLQGFSTSVQCSVQVPLDLTTSSSPDGVNTLESLQMAFRTFLINKRGRISKSFCSFVAVIMLLTKS